MHTYRKRLIARLLLFSFLLESCHNFDLPSPASFSINARTSDLSQEKDATDTTPPYATSLLIKPPTEAAAVPYQPNSHQLSARKTSNKVCQLLFNANPYQLPSHGGDLNLARGVKPLSPSPTPSKPEILASQQALCISQGIAQAKRCYQEATLSGDLSPLSQDNPALYAIF